MQNPGVWDSQVNLRPIEREPLVRPHHTFHQAYRTDPLFPRAGCKTLEAVSRSCYTTKYDAPPGSCLHSLGFVPCEILHGRAERQHVAMSQICVVDKGVRVKYTLETETHYVW